MFYICFIIISMATIGVFNYFFGVPIYGFSVWEIVLFVCVDTVAVIAIDGVFAAIIRHLLPNAWFTGEKKGFCAGKKERRFYEIVGIKRWKDAVLELGVFASFRKNKIAKPNDNEYIGRYIMEANYGIAVHIACVTVGFTVCLIPPSYAVNIGLPVACVNAFLNLLPIFILRYNLPKLCAVYKLNEKRAKRQAKDTPQK